jgi:hypothetical protein
MSPRSPFSVFAAETQWGNVGGIDAKKPFRKHFSDTKSSSTLAQLTTRVD